VSDEAPAVAGLAFVVVDSADPPALAAWWHRLLGGSVVVDADGDARLRLDSTMALDFLRVPDAKAGKNRLHLDLATTDLERATEQALALGARPAPDVYTGERWRVLRDPEGNEFCLLAPERPQPETRLTTSGEREGPRPTVGCPRHAARPHAAL
jgi:uncharacterized glyoxalase superfamily protein PhnB